VSAFGVLVVPRQGFSGDVIVAGEPVAKIGQLTALAAERPPRRVDRMPAAVHAQRFGLRQTYLL
jgi:hypothetical protein